MKNTTKNKNYERDFFKKGAILMLTFILLCGQSLTVVASPAQEPVHKCAFSLMDKKRLNPTGETYTHQHFIGYTNNNPTGVTMPVYVECTVTKFNYWELWKCACGKTEERSSVADVHSEQRN